MGELLGKCLVVFPLLGFQAGLLEPVKRDLLTVPDPEPSLEGRGTPVLRPFPETLGSPRAGSPVSPLPSLE